MEEKKTSGKRQQRIIRPADYTFSELLRSACVLFGDDHAAFISDGNKLTYGQMRDLTDRLAVSLIRDHSLTPGDKVIIIGANSNDWLAYFFAIIRAGCVAVVENPALHAEEIIKHLGRIDCSLILTGKVNTETSDVLKERFGEKALSFSDIVPAEITADDVKMLDELEKNLPARRDAISYFTSGSTSEPKVVLLPQESVVHDAYQTVMRLRETNEFYIVCVPLSHVLGLALALRYFITGGTVILCDNHPAKIIDVLRDYPVRELLDVPTVLKMMMDHPDFETVARPRIDYLISGTTTVSPEERAEFEERFGCRLIVCYGMTEASCAISIPEFDAPLEKRYETVGRALDGIDVRIGTLSSDPAADPFCRTGETGEVLVGGPTVMNGYALANDSDEIIDERGYLHTGDLGHLDEDGYLHLSGRKKNIIIKGGENIIPAEIEKAISEIKAVSSVAVIGVPDEKYGEEIAALVIPKDGCTVTIDAVREAVAKDYTRFKQPKYLLLYDAFPMSILGKPDSKALKEDALSRLKDSLEGAGSDE